MKVIEPDPKYLLQNQDLKYPVYNWIQYDTRKPTVQTWRALTENEQVSKVLFDPNLVMDNAKILYEARFHEVLLLSLVK